MIRILKDSLADFRLVFATYLSFELMYSFLASLLVVPFLSYTFNKIFMVIGKGEVLLNSDVYQMGMSFEGLVGMFAISFLAAAVFFVEFGVLIIIAQKSYFKHPVSVSQSLATSVSRLPKLIGFGIFQLFFLLLLGVPFLDASTLPPLLDLNITIILTELIHKSLLVKLIYLGLFIGVLYLYVRWIYALHFIFIENKSISKAMAASWRLTRHHKFRLVLSIVLLNLFIFAVGFLIITLISQVATIIESKALGDFIGNYLLTFSSYIAILLSLFFIPINMIILTRLYYRSLHEEGVPIDDSLTLKKVSFLTRMEAAITRLFKRSRGILISIAAISIAAIVLVNGDCNGA